MVITAIESLRLTLQWVSTKDKLTFPETRVVLTNNPPPLTLGQWSLNCEEAEAKTAWEEANYEGSWCGRVISQYWML